MTYQTSIDKKLYHQLVSLYCIGKGLKRDTVWKKELGRRGTWACKEEEGTGEETKEQTLELMEELSEA